MYLFFLPSKKGNLIYHRCQYNVAPEQRYTPLAAFAHFLDVASAHSLSLVRNATCSLVPAHMYTQE